MRRKPNKAQPTRPGRVIIFQGHELRLLKHNEPGPSGTMGGYQNMENYILDNFDPIDGACYFDATMLERLMRYCQKYGKGGPNGRLRDACIPALRRAGIELLPGWTV